MKPPKDVCFSIGLVGDEKIGKRYAVFRFSKKEYKGFSDLPLSMLSNYNYTKFCINGHTCCFSFWFNDEFKSKQDSEHYKATKYPKSQLIVACYAIDDPQTFINLQEIWLPEIRSYNHKVPIILLGTRRDNDNADSIVTRAEGEALMKKIKAKAFYETSAKYDEGIEEAFNHSAKIAIKQWYVEENKDCSIM